MCDPLTNYFIFQRLSFLICKMEVVIDSGMLLHFVLRRKVLGIGPSMEGAQYKKQVTTFLEKTVEFKLRL